MKKIVLVYISLCLMASILSAKEIYGLKSRSGGGTQFNTPVYLYKFNDSGAELILIGTVLKSDTQTQMQVDALACSDSLGLWCFDVSSAGQSVLYRLNPATAQTIGDGVIFPQRRFFGAAFDRFDRLWALDLFEGFLVTIDMETKTEVSCLKLALDDMPFTDVSAGGDIAFNDRHGVYLVLSNDIYHVNLCSGQMTKEYQDTVSAPYTQYFVGAAFASETPDWLYVFECNDNSGIDNDDIFRYDLADAFSRTTSYLGIFPEFNAGRGDLATGFPASSTTGSPDMNHNGCVNLLDFNLFSPQWGQSGGPADLNLDSRVDSQDMLLLAMQWLCEVY